MLSLDEGTAAQSVEAACASAAAFFASPPSAKQRHAARSEARGACGYRALPAKELVDIRLGCEPGLTPDALERGATLALTDPASAGRAVLAALGRRLTPRADLTALLEPAPLEPGGLGASVLRVLH